MVFFQIDNFDTCRLFLVVNHSCRDDIKPTSKREENGVRMVPDQVSYYFQLAQQHQQSLQNGGAQANPTQVTHASTESEPTSARLDRFKLRY
jgi:hypothetical protein